MTLVIESAITFGLLAVLDVACWIGLTRTTLKRKQVAVVSMALLAGAAVWLWALLAALGR
ncbi:MAG TPA: hypothetical protein VKQ36_12410 [Ktedonobacterales bacterium]|nr:hypothetical protein [Ktedonobacterales bacterium]